MEKKEVLITGDFFGGNRVAPLIDRGDFASLFGEMAAMVQSASIAVTNLESPLSDNIALRPIKKTGPALIAKTNVLDALQYAGFDLLTLANNHILDFGTAGLDSTIMAIDKSGMAYVGVGNTVEEARKVKVLGADGISVAFVNFCENEWSTSDGRTPGANPLNPVINFNDIKKAKQIADRVVVIFHGGVEFSSYPTVNLKNTCRFFADAGADAVICHHTHFISGHETYNRCPIFYGVGNFIFDNPRYFNHQWNFGYAVRLNFSSENTSYELVPYKQCNEQPGVQLLDDEEHKTFKTKMEGLNSAIADDKRLEEELELFAKTTEMVYLSYLQPFSGRILKKLFKKKLLPSVYNSDKYRLLLNIIRCESHNEVLKKVLKNNIK